MHFNAVCLPLGKKGAAGYDEQNSTPPDRTFLT